MRTLMWMGLAVAGLSLTLNGDEPSREIKTKEVPDAQIEEKLDVRTYAVADLVIPLLPDAGADFAPLVAHLRELTGREAWTDGREIQTYSHTLSLVIRQTPAVHRQIAEELQRLRKKLDTQVVIEFQIVSGPRKLIASLADDFGGELGQTEVRQLLEQVSGNKDLRLVLSPKITTFSGQTAHLTSGDRTVEAHAVVSEDRRTIQLKIVEGPHQKTSVLAAVQLITLHSGRSAALRFEAQPAVTVIPPSQDVEERLVLVTPRIIIQEEEDLAKTPKE